MEALAAFAVLGLAALAQAAAAQAQNAVDPPTAYDALPDESPALLSELFYAAAEVPGITELAPAAKRELLDVVTERHKSRLANRAAEAQPERALAYVERLSRSELAQAFPDAMRQACAQHGLSEGPCAAPWCWRRCWPPSGCPWTAWRSNCSARPGRRCGRFRLGALRPQRDP